MWLSAQSYTKSMIKENDIQKVFEEILGQFGFSLEFRESNIPFRKNRFFDFNVSSHVKEQKECVIGIDKKELYISDFLYKCDLLENETFSLSLGLDVKGDLLDLFNDTLLVGIVWYKKDGSIVSTNEVFDGSFVDVFLAQKQGVLFAQLENHRHFALRRPGELDSVEPSAEDSKQLIVHTKQVFDVLHDLFINLPSCMEKIK